MRALVFDLGGTHLRCGLSDTDGSVRQVETSRIISFTSGVEPKLVWKGVSESILDFVARAGTEVPAAAPIVVSFPGPIAPGFRLVDAPTVAGNMAPLPDLAVDLRQATGRRTYILNDMTAAAWYLSEVIPAERFLVLTISSGIGSKIFDRRHPDGVLAQPAYAGEIGHVKVDDSTDALECDCGGRGHLGAIASGRGIERLARLSASASPSAFQRSACVQRFGATATALTNEAHVVPAAKLGDPWALAVITQATKPLAPILLATVLAAGLEKVAVIGGFAMALGTAYIDILRSALVDSCDYRLLASEIERLLLFGDADSCLRGAAVYAQRVTTPLA